MTARENMGLSAMDRLRWKVLRTFGVLPGSRLARQISDRDVIYAGLNMVLDLGAQGLLCENSGFDMEKFSSLKGE